MRLRRGLLLALLATSSFEGALGDEFSAAVAEDDLAANETVVLDDGEAVPEDAEIEDASEERSSSLIASIRELLMRKRIVRKVVRKQPMRRPTMRRPIPAMVHNTGSQPAGGIAVAGMTLHAANTHEGVKQAFALAAVLGFICCCGCIWHCINIQCEKANHGKYSSLPYPITITPRQRREHESPRVMQLYGGMLSRPANWKNKFHAGMKQYKSLSRLSESTEPPPSIQDEALFTTKKHGEDEETERVAESQRWTEDGSEMIC